MAEQMVRDGDLISRNLSVVGADTVDETILINIDSGNFYQLNKTAARIWALVEHPQSFAALCSAIQAAFDVTAESCRAEVAEFVVDLEGRGLLKIGA